MKKDFSISSAHKLIGMHQNLPFWISMIRVSQLIIPQNTSKVVLDFGCGDGKFLPLFNLMDNLKKGVGVEIDANLVCSGKSNDCDKIKTLHYDELKQYENYFDVVYSQEVLYTLKDLTHHAKEIFNCMKSGSYYFSTMGSHIQNPLWAHRRALIKNEESYPVFDYSIEDVANIFFNAGFEVGLKRLPVDYFVIYDPKLTKKFSKSYLDLVDSTHENKMLFLFYKK